MPVLEHLGLRVFAEDAVSCPRSVMPRPSPDLPRQDGEGKRLDVARDAERLVATILAVRQGTVESDGLNRLVLGAALSWQQIQVLRAYTAYAFQIGAAPSRRARARR